MIPNGPHWLDQKALSMKINDYNYFYLW
jgi:hypothetical protein